MSDELRDGHRGLDTLIAEKLFGFRQMPSHNSEQFAWIPPGVPDTGVPQSPGSLWWLGRPLDYLVPRYSGSLDHAFEVVEKMRSDQWGWSFTLRNDMDGWQCSFGPDVLAFGDTVPLAICLAAVQALAGKP